MKFKELVDESIVQFKKFIAEGKNALKVLDAIKNVETSKLMATDKESDSPESKLKSLLKGLSTEKAAETIDEMNKQLLTQLSDMEDCLVGFEKVKSTL